MLQFIPERIHQRTYRPLVFSLGLGLAQVRRFKVKNWFVVGTLTYNFCNQWCYKFSNGYMVTWLISLTICHFRVSIFLLETLKFKKKGWYSHWQCSQYFEMNLACDLSAHAKDGWIPGKLQKLESKQRASCESWLILSDTHKFFKIQME